MKKIIVAVGIIILTVITFSCGKQFHNSRVDEKSWAEVVAVDNSKPIARHEAAFVNVSDKFYLLGGRGIRPVSIFNPTTQKWEEGEKPPIEIHHFQPVVYENKIYIIGAMTGKYPLETPVKNILVYNTSTNKWEVGDAIPTQRLRGSTGNVIKNELVYISCGISNGHINGHKKWFESYNIKTGEWKILPDSPQARDHFQSVEANGKIYNLAGRLSKAPHATFTETIAKVDVYNIKKNEWSTIENEIPTQRAGNMALLYKNDILVIGGESIHQNKAHNQVEALNTKNHTWRSYSNLIQGRHGTGAFIFNNIIYIASGCGNRGGSPELTTMEKY